VRLTSVRPVQRSHRRYVGAVPPRGTSIIPSVGRTVNG
jgi:hypothetical protein